MKGERVLVIGGRPSLRFFVVEELLRRRCELSVFHNEPAEQEYSGPVKRFFGSSEDGEALRRAAAEFAPARLVMMEQAGASQARALIEAFADRVLHSVCLSSSAVYRAGEPSPLTEDSATIEPSDRNPDQAVLDHLRAYEALRWELCAAVLRLPAVYGPREEVGREWFFVKRILDGRKRIALPEGGLHLLHRGFVQNLAWGIAQSLASQRTAGAVINLGDEHVPNVRQLAQQIAASLDHSWEIYSVPGDLWWTPFSEMHFLDLHRAKSRLHYRDRLKPKDTTELTVAWLLQHPPVEWPLARDDAFDYEKEDALIERWGVRVEGLPAEAAYSAVVAPATKAGSAKAG